MLTLALTLTLTLALTLTLNLALTLNLTKARCEHKHFVPMGCHKCWFWNHRTWRFMVEHCPMVKTMRALRKEYRIGIEFTDWPTRPKANPIKGPILPDVRWKPIDLIEGTCVGRCGYGTPRPFKKTVKGLYHK